MPQCSLLDVIQWVMFSSHVVGALVGDWIADQTCTLSLDVKMLEQSSLFRSTPNAQNMSLLEISKALFFEDAT